MKYLKTKPFILALSLLSVTGVLAVSPAWADVTITTEEETAVTDSSSDPAEDEDVRSASEETCDEVTNSHLRVSRC